jgi:iron complex transport system substrate-binding protein
MKFEMMPHRAGKTTLRGQLLATLFVAFSVFLFLSCADLAAQTPVAPQPDRSSTGSRTADRLKPVQVTDEVGRRVKIPAKVRRVVSLAPNLTEIVFALGKGDQLSGDTDFCDYPPAATQKPHVGGPINPNLEQIVALMPDLILATKSINRRETVDALDRLGVPVYVTDPHSVDGMIASVEHIGGAMHSEESPGPLVTDLRERLAELDRGLAGSVPRRVLFVVWSDPLISVGRDTFIADALRHAGARSVVDTTVEWPRVSIEEMVHLQPEFLVFASEHTGEKRPDIEALRARPGWRNLDAVRDGKIVIISDSINRPAPRMVDAIEQLARALHPESFASSAHPAQNATQISEEACACAR